MFKIYLSPSTQENNIGAGDYGSEEFRMNQLADLMIPYLKAAGYEVYRNKPSMSLKEVVAESNAIKPDIHLAVHSNAANAKARGLEIYCHRFGGQGEKLARSIYALLEPLTPAPGRGVKEGANHYGPGKPMYETAYTSAPAALIEVSFHDNSADAKFIIENLPLLAKTIAGGINSYFGIEENPGNQVPEVPTETPLDEYKRIIQEKCGFSYPQGVWEVVDTHPYAQVLYEKWAKSYS